MVGVHIYSKNFTVTDWSPLKFSQTLSNSFSVSAADKDQGKHLKKQEFQGYLKLFYFQPHPCAKMAPHLFFSAFFSN